jgi:hypothetical protein
MNLGGLTNGVKFTSGGGISNTFTLPSATGYTFTFPNATGTIALTSDIPSLVGYVPYTGATTNVDLGNNSLKSRSLHLKQNDTINVAGVGYGTIATNTIQQFVFYWEDATYAKRFNLDFSALSPLGSALTYTLPNASGTIALVGGSGVGTVTSVSALTIGTSGTDLSSSVATSTTTPVITLNVPTASATNRGALSSADWTTFNNKQSALTNPVLASGTWTSGYLPKINGTYTIGNSLVQDNGSTVSITTGSTVLSLDRTGGATALLELKTGGTVRGYLGADASMPFVFYNQSPTALMYLNSSGNLGLGVTPSAWASPFVNIQVGNGAGFTGRTDAMTAYMSSNYYYNSGDKYIGTGNASLYIQTTGQHIWYNAPSGTAGNAITFTQAMTLSAIGLLGIGTPSPLSYLDIFCTNASYDNLRLRLNSAGGGNFGIRAFVQGISNGGLQIYDYVNSATALVIAATSNNILINSTTDSGYKLDVNGTGRFSGDLTTNGTAYISNATSLALSINSTTNNPYLRFQQSSVTKFFIGERSAVSGDGGTGYDIYAVAGNDIRFFAGATKALTLATTGAATFSSSVTATSFFESSDSRLKTLIQDNYQTKGIASITPKLYTKNGKVELGYYAQDFVGILDSAVSKGSDDMLSLSYREVLVAKVYALEQEIKELKAKMN